MRSKGSGSPRRDRAAAGSRGREKNKKTGRINNPVPRGVYGTSAAPPPLRPRACLRAAAALLRRCAAESPAEERGCSPLRPQVPAAARGWPRTPRPRRVSPIARPHPKAPAPPVARTRAPPPRSAPSSSRAAAAGVGTCSRGPRRGRRTGGGGVCEPAAAGGGSTEQNGGRYRRRWAGG